MEEEQQRPGSVLPVQGAVAGSPASRAMVNSSQPARRRMVIVGILVLVLIAAAVLVFWLLSAPADPVIGMWSVEPAGLQMQFDADGTATLRYPDTGDYATGRWEKVEKDRYHLLSAKGTASPPLSYDPISDTLHTDDFSLIFVRKGG